MDYGKAGGLGRPNVPPTFFPGYIKAEDINNQPAVTQRGNVLFSSVEFSDSVSTLYQLMDWEGNHLADIGQVPKGSELTLDYEKLRSDVSDRLVPAFYRPKAFPVMDHANPEEYFLIYSAFPRIDKYDSSGERLWSKKVKNIPEIDSIKTQFYDSMEKMQQAGRRNRINLDYYVAGISGPDGNLYLIMDTTPIIIHHFNDSGELIHRYKLKSEDAELAPIFDIDFSLNRIMIVTEKGKIRAYPF